MISRFFSLVFFFVVLSDSVFATSLPKTMAPRHVPKRKVPLEDEHYVGSPVFPLNISSEMKKKMQLNAVEKLAEDPESLNNQDHKVLCHGNSPLDETHNHALFMIDPHAELDVV